MAIGSRRAPGDRAVDGDRREEVLRNMPARSERSDGSGFAEDTAWRDDFPNGTRFAAALQGATAAADGKEPVVEKNTESDGNDGIYFPNDAQLAYPNRAGVQGEAGTVALWVEPVDWDGQDAGVHSFFRLNDPTEGGYRFHLLKDSSNLRFQFMTEHGENNVRVPIDWWPQGEGHHVAATWDSNVLRLYVDGVAMGEQAYQGTLRVPANVPGWWGSNLESGTQGAGAVLKNTLVADRPFAEAEIQGLSQAK